MTAGPYWGQAQAAVEQLKHRPGDRRTLLLLARLPLGHERVIERLAGLRGGASVYRGLRRLAAGGLVAAIRPPCRADHGPRLWYLTDLGLATVALDQGRDPRHLARRGRLRGADLQALLPGLPRLQDAYELLGALAASRPGRPNLLAWECPWRYRYQRPTAKTPVTVALPAYAALAWDGQAAEYLLLPDSATFPLRLYGSVLDHLLVLRGRRGGAFPILVVATSDRGRAADWEALLEEIRERRAEAPLAACIATWADLPVGLTALGAVGGSQRPPEALIRRLRVRSGRPRPPAGPLPRLVGDALRPPAVQPHGDGGLGRVALRLSRADRALVDLIGRHPFLALDRLAAVLGGSRRTVRQSRDRLIAQGLLRLLEPGEVRGDAGSLELVELTAAGLALAAAQQGLTLGAAVRANGLAGGGPVRPIGARRRLLAHPAHTLGTDEIFVDLVRTARRLAATGRDDALVEWRNAAACSRRHVRPDGYGLYRTDGQLYGFFLEYDRGTMSGRDYRAKFAAYYAYWASGRFERDYNGFPTMLVVTIDPGAEQRIAQALRSAGVGWSEPLPALLTTTGRIAAHPDGLLGPIWREPDRAERRPWPALVGSFRAPVELPGRPLPQLASQPRVVPS